MTGPENVTAEICNERGRLAFAKAMEKIIDEMAQTKPNPELLEALAACATAAFADFESSE